MKSEFIYLLSNFILTCYGLLVKSYKDVELIEQVYMRTIVFSLLSLGLLSFHATISLTTVWLSIINFISIYGIYVAFEKLGLGITQAVFYTWPLLFYIIADKSFNIGDLSILLTTFFFVFLIYKPMDVPGEPNNPIQNNQKLLGLLGVLASIITHVYILTYYKKYQPPITEYLFNQYGFIFIVLSIYYLWQWYSRRKSTKPNSINLDKPINDYYKTLTYIIIFNLLLGYLGFYLQFLSVGQLRPYIISLLTFISILISIFLDRLVFKQELTRQQWVGIIGIIIMTTIFRK